MLKLVVRKRPLQDLTDNINRPVQPIEVQPNEFPVRAVDVSPIPVPAPDNPVPVEPPFQAFEEVHSIPSSPARSVGFLSDLFEPIDSETLECKVDRALDNQKILLSLLSKIMGEVAQISRALRLGGECVLQDLGGIFLRVEKTEGTFLGV